jgi:hypothetical protein
VEKLRSKDIRNRLGPVAVTLAIAAAVAGFEIGSHEKPDERTYQECPPGYVGGDTLRATSLNLRGIAIFAGAEGIKLPDASQLICINGKESYFSPTAQEISGESEAVKLIQIRKHNQEQELLAQQRSNG